MTIGPNFVQLTADVLTIFFIKFVICFDTRPSDLVPTDEVGGLESDY